MFKIMRIPEKGKVATPQTLNASFDGTPFKIDFSWGFSVCASVTDSTAVDGETFVSGVLETQTLTFPATAGATNNDYLHLSDYAGGSWGVALAKPAYAVATVNFADTAATANNDYFHFVDTAGNSWAAALGKPAFAKVTVNFADEASTVVGDYITWVDTSGNRWGIGLNLDGTTEPVSAEWTAINAARKDTVDVTGLGTDVAIAAAVETAMNALTGFAALFTTDDTAANGTMTITSDAYGATGTPTAFASDGIAASSAAVTLTTTGVALTAPSGAIYTAIAAGRKVVVDLTAGADVNDEDIAASVKVALEALTGFTALFTITDPADGTLVITSDAYGATGATAPHNTGDSGAGSIATTLSTTGVALTAPTGAIWTAIAGANKSVVDLTAAGASTAAQVAAAVELAIDALTGFSAVITTDDSAANGTMLLTAAVRGPVTNPVPKNADDSGAGSIAGVQTAAGVTSNVDLTTEEITVVGHNMVTGLKIQLTTSSALPTGLSTATDYYVIAIDDDTFQLALSLADAEAGTEIDLTGYGTGTHTIDVQEDLTGTIKLQASNNCFKDNVNSELRSDAIWVDIPNCSVSLDGGNDSVFWNVADAHYEAVRIVWTRTAGNGEMSTYIIAKGEG